MGFLGMFPEQASNFAAEVDYLYLFMIAVTVVFTLGIFAAVFYFAIRYRRRSDDMPVQTQYHTLTEIIYTIAPIVIGSSGSSTWRGSYPGRNASTCS